MEANVKCLENTAVNVEVSASLKELIDSKEELSHIQNSLQENGLLSSSDLKHLADSINGPPNENTISGEELDNALEELLANGKKIEVDCDGVSLHSVIKNSKLKLPVNPVVDRNPELAARVDRLRRQQDEQAYQSMTKGISAGKFYKEDTVAFQLRMMNRQLIAVGQVVISVAAGFAFGFLGIPLLVGGMEFGVRILLGLFSAGVIAVAELYFLVKHMHAEDVNADHNASSGSESLPNHLHVD